MRCAAALGRRASAAVTDDRCPLSRSRSPARRGGTRPRGLRPGRLQRQASYAPEALAPLTPSPRTQTLTSGYFVGQYHTTHTWNAPWVQASAEYVPTPRPLQCSATQLLPTCPSKVQPNAVSDGQRSRQK